LNDFHDDIVDLLQGVGFRIRIDIEGLEFLNQSEPSICTGDGIKFAAEFALCCLKETPFEPPSNLSFHALSLGIGILLCLT
jgi:hypothetical protein